MGQHGAHVREVEPLLALAVGKLDLVLRQVRARLDGQAGKPGRGRAEDPSHQIVPSIKERIVNRARWLAHREQEFERKLKQ